MIERPDVDTLLSGELGQWLQGQALVRDSARATSNSRFIMAGIAVVGLSALLLLGLAWDGQIKAWIIGLGAIGAGVWAYAPRAAAIKQTKEGINSALASALGLSYLHDTAPGPGFERARNFKMVPHFDQSSFEDLWHGDIAGRGFALHEAELKQRRSTGKSTHYVTVFRGPVMTIACARQFHGTTLVERAKKHRKFGIFGEKDELEIAELNLTKVDMVHPGFEDEFTIYSTDQVEARYLVHPTYVERLIALEQAFSGKKIRTLFHAGEVTVVLETENMFESGGMNAARDREMVETCVAQFMSMAELAGTLNEPGR